VKRCSFCGKKFEDEVFANAACSYDCDRSIERLNLWEQGKLVIINQNAYLPHPENHIFPRNLLGYAGRHFTIRKFSGAVIRTNNLKNYGSAVSLGVNDTAEFIETEE